MNEKIIEILKINGYSKIDLTNRNEVNHYLKNILKHYEALIFQLEHEDYFIKDGKFDEEDQEDYDDFTNNIKIIKDFVGA